MSYTSSTYTHSSTHFDPINDLSSDFLAINISSGGPQRNRSGTGDDRPSTPSTPLLQHSITTSINNNRETLAKVGMKCWHYTFYCLTLIGSCMCLLLAISAVLWSNLVYNCPEATKENERLCKVTGLGFDIGSGAMITILMLMGFMIICICVINRHK